MLPVAGEIIQQVDLSRHNTLGVPAIAAHVAHATTREHIIQAIAYANDRLLPIHVLGEGSNVVLSQVIPGLVILNRLSGIEVLSETDSDVTLRVASGENWHQFVEHCLAQGWYGLENLALIPGLVGAAPVQNIGAYGVEVANFLDSVEYLDLTTGATKKLCHQECQFAYRDSVFKRELAHKTAIVCVELSLKKIAEPNVSYAALSEVVGDSARPQQIFDAVCRLRRAKLPDPRECPNAGSFFKNPVVDQTQYEKLREEFPDLVYFKQGKKIKLAAAWLIDRLGWKQKELAGVRVHEQQALVITNPKHVSGATILEFADAIRDEVEEVFGVVLEIEPQRL